MTENPAPHVYRLNDLVWVQDGLIQRPASVIAIGEHILGVRLEEDREMHLVNKSKVMPRS